MSSTSVSILVPLAGPAPELPSTLETIERYLQATGFAFDIRVLDRRDGAGYGAMIRRGAADAGGSVVIIVDPDLPYPVSAIGDAVALIESGAAEVVFGRRDGCRDSIVLRSLLVPILPDRSVLLKAFSSDAARLLIAESKLRGGGLALAAAYLANKYAFRIERLTVRAAKSKTAFGFWGDVGTDRAAPGARAARSRGLEVYCSTVPNFVNTGPAFDAIVLFHVFENMPEPHDALSRMKDLLKPGGVLLLSTFDTEGLVYLMTERRWMTQNFRTHLILYSRSALIELLEHSGFEIVSIGAELAYRDHRFLRHSVAMRWPALAPLVRVLLKVLPDPLLLFSGSIRIVAKRRAGSPVNFSAIRSVEPTHAR